MICSAIQGERGDGEAGAVVLRQKERERERERRGCGLTQGRAVGMERK